MACVGTRYLVCFTTWIALLVFYILRSNMSVAILPMASGVKDENDQIVIYFTKYIYLYCRLSNLFLIGIML